MKQTASCAHTDTKGTDMIAQPFNVGDEIRDPYTNAKYRVQRVNTDSITVERLTHLGLTDGSSIVVWNHETNLFVREIASPTCDMPTEDGNRDDPLTYYCGHPRNHGGDCGKWYL